MQTSEKSNYVERTQNVTFKFNRLMAQLDSLLTTNAFILLSLFIYVCAVTLMFFWGARDQYYHTEDASMRWYITIARAFGYTLNLNCALVVLLASRLMFTLIRDTRLNLFIPFDKSFPAFHIIVACVVAVAVIFHATFHFIWIIGWDQWGPGTYGVNMTVGTGIALAIVLAIMVVLSLPRIRRTHYTTFYLSHNIGALLFFGLLMVHGVYNGVPYTYKWITGPIFIYLFDRIARNLKVCTAQLKLKGSNYSLKGGNILRLDIQKSFDYRSGHYAELQVPSINRTEWHPFTIASAPEEKKMTFYIKTLGDWTQALRREFEKRISGETNSTLDVYVRGPFGAPAQHVDGYDRIVLISGGIGATPFVSVCKHVYNSMKLSEIDEDMNFSEAQNDKLSSAERHLTRGINTAFDRGGDLVRYETWEYAQSTALVSSPSERTIPSPRSAIISPRNQPSPRSVVTPRSIVTPRSAPVLGSARTKSRNGLQLHSPPAVQSSSTPWGRPTGRPGRTPRTLPKERNEEVWSMMSPLTAEDATISSVGPARPWPLSRDVVGLSFRGGTEAAASTAETESEAETSSMSFAKQTLNIDDAATATAVRSKAEVRLRIRTMRLVQSVTANMGLCITLVIRFVLLGFIHLFHNPSTKGPMMLPGHEAAVGWMTAIDVALGLFLASAILICVGVELVALGRAFFHSIGRVIDLVLLVPCAATSNALGMYALTRTTKGVPSAVAATHFALLVGGLGLLLILRLARVVGTRVALADRHRDCTFTKLRAIDFLWTTPTDADDEWIRDELRDLANGRTLRLHRFITRASPEYHIEGVEDDNSPGMMTNIGRPQWDDLFTRIAERTPSDSKVGVFFCGPHPMAKAISEAMRRVQVKTLLRGVYLGTSKDDALQQHLGVRGECELDTLRARGSNIQFVLRKENFG